MTQSPTPNRRVPAPLPHLPRHTAGMDDVVYMVRGRTRAICQRELDRICQLLDARPTMRPTDGVGRGWVARAVPTTKTPAEDGRGLGVPS